MKTPIDPVKKAEQFKIDMAAMNVGRKEDGGAVKQRVRAAEFGVQSYKFTRWSATLTETQSLEDALDPVFWSDVAHKITGDDKANPKGRGDIIEVRKLDTGLYAELLIVETGSNLVRTQIIRTAEPEAVEIPKDSPFETRWNAGSKRHEVLRRADKAIMAGNFQTQAGAAKWIADHMKALKAA